MGIKCKRAVYIDLGGGAILHWPLTFKTAVVHQSIYTSSLSPPVGRQMRPCGSPVLLWFVRRQFNFTVLFPQAFAPVGPQQSLVWSALPMGVLSSGLGGWKCVSLHICGGGRVWFYCLCCFYPLWSTLCYSMYEKFQSNRLIDRACFPAGDVNQNAHLLL